MQFRLQFASFRHAYGIVFKIRKDGRIRFFQRVIRHFGNAVVIDKTRTANVGPRLVELPNIRTAATERTAAATRDNIAQALRLQKLTAVNITELYHLLEQLEQKHLELKKMNGRLWQYSENMESYVRSREILETKMRIHKEIGQALLASRVYISQKIPELTEQDILKRWESVVLVLKKEAEPEVPENKWLQFVRAAGDAGVQVAASGSIPTDPVQQEYLLMAAVEALTNAVRHGEADQLKIVLTEENGYIRACFFNNGKKPIAPVREGGGLGALRIRLEEAGGSMQILTTPEFCLSVLLPKKGGKEVCYRYRS